MAQASCIYRVGSSVMRFETKMQWLLQNVARSDHALVATTLELWYGPIMPYPFLLGAYRKGNVSNHRTGS